MYSSVWLQGIHIKYRDEPVSGQEFEPRYLLLDQSCCTPEWFVTG